MTGPVAVGELLAAWRAVEAGVFRGGHSDLLNGQPELDGHSPRPSIGWQPGCLVVPVLAAHRGCGATGLALAMATAVGDRVHLVECAPPLGSGLPEAATAELGVTGAWVRGTRGAVVIDRLARPTTALPVPEVLEGPPVVAILDPSADLATAVTVPGWVCETVRAAPRVVLVTTATVPGLRRLEAATVLLGPDRVVAAVLGPPARRWPRPVARAAGPFVDALIERRVLVDVTPVTAFRVSGVTGDPLPAGVLAAAGLLLGRLLPTPTRKDSP